jgi:hypothetical protein
MAAGLGFKTFTTGEVLTAADTNGYLMQGILVFASAAARDAAITSPQEGQCCYLKDTDAVQTYSGSAWVGFDDSNAIQNSIVDAKGDIVAASGNDTPARLAVGSNGTTLVADSAEATGLKWANVNINPNLVINGNFTINQRGYVSAANLASGSYGFDRWKSNFTNTTLTFTSAPAGQSVTINSGGGLQQIVEQADVPAGTYTLSFSGTATGRIYNSGATPPSYAASPISFTADGSANVVVEFTAVSTTKTLSKVKLELGTTATTYVYAGGTIQGELAACQRYYEKSYAQATAPGTSSSTSNSELFMALVALSGSNLRQMSRFKVTKRVSPTVTLYSSNNGATGNWYNEGTTTNVAAVAYNIGDIGFQSYQSAGTTNATNVLLWHYTAEAEL